MPSVFQARQAAAYKAHMRAAVAVHIMAAKRAALAKAKLQENAKQRLAQAVQSSSKRQAERSYTEHVRGPYGWLGSTQSDLQMKAQQNLQNEIGAYQTALGNYNAGYKSALGTFNSVKVYSGPGNNWSVNGSYNIAPGETYQAFLASQGWTQLANGKFSYKPQQQAALQSQYEQISNQVSNYNATYGSSWRAPETWSYRSSTLIPSPLPSRSSLITSGMTNVANQYAQNNAHISGIVTTSATDETRSSLGAGAGTVSSSKVFTPSQMKTYNGWLKQSNKQFNNLMVGTGLIGAGLTGLIGAGLIGSLVVGPEVMIPALGATGWAAVGLGVASGAASGILGNVALGEGAHYAASGKFQSLGTPSLNPISSKGGVENEILWGGAIGGALSLGGVKSLISGNAALTVVPKSEANTFTSLIEAQGESYGAVGNAAQRFSVMAGSKNLGTLDVASYTLFGKPVTQLSDEEASTVSRFISNTYINPSNEGLQPSIEINRGISTTKSIPISIPIKETPSDYTLYKTEIMTRTITRNGEVINPFSEIGFANGLTISNPEGEGAQDLLGGKFKWTKEGYKITTEPYQFRYNTPVGDIIAENPLMPIKGTRLTGDWEALSDEQLETLKSLGNVPKYPKVKIIETPESNGIDNLKISPAETTAKSPGTALAPVENSHGTPQLLDRSTIATRPSYLYSEEDLSGAAQRYVEANREYYLNLNTDLSLTSMISLGGRGLSLSFGLLNGLKTRNLGSLQSRFTLKETFKEIETFKKIELLTFKASTKTMTTTQTSTTTTTSEVPPIPQLKTSDKSDKIAAGILPRTKHQTPAPQQFFPLHGKTSKRKITSRKSYFAFPDLLNENEYQFATGKRAHALRITPENKKVYNAMFQKSMGLNIRTQEQLSGKKSKRPARKGFKLF